MRISDWSSDVCSSDLAVHRRLESIDLGAGAGHAISAPPPNEKKDRKKELAAKAIDRPKMIWISRRKPPAVSPKASVNPVTIMMITATILATGPSTASNTCCNGSSPGIPDPAARAAAARALPSHATAAAVTDLFGCRPRARRPGERRVGEEGVR